MRIKYNRPNIYKACGVRLLPGINRIDEDKIPEAFWQTPGVQARIESGAIEIVEADDGTKADGGKTTAKDLIAAMPDTYDRDYLEQLMQDERKSVAEAAKKQHAALFGSGE